MDLELLGKVLGERREAIGLSRGIVARRVGVSPSYVSMVERAVERQSGQPSQPSVGVLKGWAEALGWDEDGPYTRQLLGLAGHLPPKSQPTPQFPFGGVGALHFPNPKRMERDRLVQELRELLDAAQTSDTQWEETLRLLKSYFEWLNFRLREQQ